MKKKSLVMTVAALAAFTSIASAAPATSWEQGQWQVDLGASDPKAKFDGLESDTKWNFNGGLGYALSDKWALRYDYHGLKTEAGDFKTAGDENEVNLMYSLGRNAALFAGWARINNDFDGSVARGTYGIDSSDSVVNNVAQFGAIVKADLAKNLALYAEGALGTKKTSMWEAGLSYTIAKDWDLNAGYRYLDTKLDDDNNIKYRGFLVGLTYRLAGIRQKLLLSWKNRLLLWKNRSKNRPMFTMTTIWTAFILPLMMISHFLLNGTRWTILSRLPRIIRILRSNWLGIRILMLLMPTMKTFPSAVLTMSPSTSPIMGFLAIV